MELEDVDESFIVNLETVKTRITTSNFNLKFK